LDLPDLCGIGGGVFQGIYLAGIREPDLEDPATFERLGVDQSGIAGE
jgi:hypothetical protein